MIRTDNNYDIIIPTAEKDLNFLPMVIKYIHMNLSAAKHVYIITKDSNFLKLDKVSKEHNCYLLDENKLVDNLTFDKVRQMIIHKKWSPSWTGWYFQQFLKMAFAETEYCRGYYLSWDSDTLPLSHINFFKDGHPIFTLKKEYHKPYFDTIEKILGLKKQIENSFIAEHMLFNGIIMKELLNAIGNDWFEKILSTFPMEKEGHYYSEFETYGTFTLAKHPDFYQYQQLNTFRKAGMIRGRYINEKILNALSVDLDIASFELYDAMFPFNLEKEIFLLKRKSNRLLRMLGLK